MKTCREYALFVETFIPEWDVDPSFQARKCQEETGEVLDATARFEEGSIEVDAVCDEIADAIMACCNLANVIGGDMQAAMARCIKRQKERGRYALPSGV